MNASEFKDWLRRQGVVEEPEWQSLPSPNVRVKDLTAVNIEFKGIALDVHDVISPEVLKSSADKFAKRHEEFSEYARTHSDDRVDALASRGIMKSFDFSK